MISVRFAHLYLHCFSFCTCAGRTALYEAVEHKASAAIVETLLKAGANPNQTDISLTPMVSLQHRTMQQKRRDEFGWHRTGFVSFESSLYRRLCRL